MVIATNCVLPFTSSPFLISLIALSDRISPNLKNLMNTSLIDGQTIREELII